MIDALFAVQTNLAQLCEIGDWIRRGPNYGIDYRSKINMNQIKWYMINDSHVKHFVGTDSYLAHVTEYGRGQFRAWVDVPNVLDCKEAKWFDTIDEAKEWAISTLVEHAKSAIAEAQQAQEFLDLVEGGELLEKSRDA